MEESLRRATFYRASAARSTAPPCGSQQATARAAFDAGGNGLGRSHQVGIWTEAGALLATATVGAGTAGTLIDHFRYVAIAPLTLAAGSYIIAAADFGGQGIYGVAAADEYVYNVSGLAGSAHVAYLDDRSGFGSALVFPTSNLGPNSTVGGFSNGFWGANFRYDVAPPPKGGGGAVPEPASALLAGMATLGALARRRARA